MSCLNYLKSMFKFSTVCWMPSSWVYGLCIGPTSPFTARAWRMMMLYSRKHDDRQTNIIIRLESISKWFYDNSVCMFWICWDRVDAWSRKDFTISGVIWNFMMIGSPCFSIELNGQIVKVMIIKSRSMDGHKRRFFNFSLSLSRSHRRRLDHI